MTASTGATDTTITAEPTFVIATPAGIATPMSTSTAAATTTPTSTTIIGATAAAVIAKSTSSAGTEKLQQLQQN